MQKMLYVSLVLYHTAKIVLELTVPCRVKGNGCRDHPLCLYCRTNNLFHRNSNIDILSTLSVS